MIALFRRWLNRLKYAWKYRGWKTLCLMKNTTSRTVRVFGFSILNMKYTAEQPHYAELYRANNGNVLYRLAWIADTRVDFYDVCGMYPMLNPSDSVGLRVTICNNREHIFSGWIFTEL